MSDVNEEIVRRFFEVHGYLVRLDVRFWKGKEQTGKESSGYGDVDLVAYNLKTDDLVAAGVSAWHQESITPAHAKGEDPRIFDFTTQLADQAITGIVGNRPFRRVLVVSILGPRNSERREFLMKARKKGIREVIEFPEVVKFLLTWVDTKRGYESETLHILALLKNYGIEERWYQRVVLWSEEGISRTRWFETEGKAKAFGESLVREAIADEKPEILDIRQYATKRQIAEPGVRP